jgi:hypothetical protein
MNASPAARHPNAISRVDHMVVVSNHAHDFQLVIESFCYQASVVLFDCEQFPSVYAASIEVFHFLYRTASTMA